MMSLKGRVVSNAADCLPGGGVPLPANGIEVTQSALTQALIVPSHLRANDLRISRAPVLGGRVHALV